MLPLPPSPKGEGGDTHDGAVLKEETQLRPPGRPASRQMSILGEARWRSSEAHPQILGEAPAGSGSV